MSNELNLGQLIKDPASARRDATHVAVVPVQAAEDLWAGCHLRLIEGSQSVVAHERDREKSVGIADPFLKDHSLRKGQWFWMWIKPGTVIGMRHAWSHPAFNDDPDVPAVLGERTPPKPRQSTTPSGPPWLTETVTRLCKRILDDNDVPALAVLHDALIDAGFDDQQVLADCLRDYSYSYQSVAARRIVCLIQGGEAADAVRVVESIAAEMELTYNSVMQSAQEFNEASEEDYYDYHVIQNGSELWRDVFSKHKERFWVAYKVITGVEPRSVKNFYSCSC